MRLRIREFRVESYLQGVSTRKIREIVSYLGIDQLSPALVSRMAKDLDDQVQAFLLRPIEQAIPSSSWMIPTTKSATVPGMSPRRSWWCRGARRRLPGDPGCESHGL